MKRDEHLIPLTHDHHHALRTSGSKEKTMFPLIERLAGQGLAGVKLTARDRSRPNGQLNEQGVSN